MICLTSDDIMHLYYSVHGISENTCYTGRCGTCEVKTVCRAISRIREYGLTDVKDKREYLRNACIDFRELTDTMCDTYSCPHCQNYGWCTVLRGIAIEGVMLI